MFQVGIQCLVKLTSERTEFNKQFMARANFNLLEILDAKALKFV